MRNNKFEGQNFAGKETVGVFWDSEGILLQEFLKRSGTINSERYVQTFKMLKQRIQWVRPNRKMDQVHILHTVPNEHPPLPSLWLPEGCTLRTPFCGRRRAETKRA